MADESDAKNDKSSHKILIIMGVSGSGKTTVGKLLADKLSFTFYDADDFHPTENKVKMASGVPLSDEDRWPWLEILREKILEWRANQTDAILACSALKEKYRDYLVFGDTNDPTSQTDRFKENSVRILFIYLKGSAVCIRNRMSQRVGHFMPSDLLESQFKDLEEPTNAENCLTLDIDNDAEDLVKTIIKYLY
eukprot:Seg4983.2 transcript_id=Seg4983.2/GoldUCD/mRNA.D3Y31 product="putative gluconokinase" protein_id=Seg4983.2/GoldUCD/D3Y31